MKYLKLKLNKNKKKIYKKPGRPKKLPTRASNHQKKYAKVIFIQNLFIE